jgi:archaellum component FlaC
VSRESRLILAEELEVDMKNNLTDFIKSIDELDAAINQISRTEEVIDEKLLPRILDLIKEKTARVRKSVAELDARIERTVTEWENLKQHEIGLHILEQQIRKSPHQE